KQALLPRGAIVIPNALGTAPGYRLAHGAKHLVVLPGVPREMKPMMAETVLPWLVELRGGDQVYLARVFQTFGLTESGLDEMVAGAIDPSEGRVSFRASFPEISLRVVVHGRPDEARARLDALAARIRARIGPYVYGEGAVTLEEVVGRLLGERRDGPLPALGHTRLGEAARLAGGARLDAAPRARPAGDGVAALPPQGCRRPVRDTARARVGRWQGTPYRASMRSRLAVRWPLVQGSERRYSGARQSGAVHEASNSRTI